MTNRGTLPLLVGLVIALTVGANAGSKPPREHACFVPGCAICSLNDPRACEVCDTAKGYVLLSDNTCHKAAVANPKAKICRGEPSAAPNAQPWPKKCKFEKIGTSCMTVCRPGFTSAAPVTAFCSAGGVWEITGACQNQPPAPACPGVPPTAENANAFEASCKDGQARATCNAACAEGYTGTGAVATCDATKGWIVTAQCSQVEPPPPPPPAVCESSPEADNVDYFVDNETGGDCTDLAIGASCDGACTAGFGGTPVAICGEDGNWSVDGECTAAAVDCPDYPPATDGALPWEDFANDGSNVCFDARDGDYCDGACEDGMGYATAACTNEGWFVDADCGTGGARRRK